ncbi:chemotaxis protein CheB [Sphingobacterium sp. Mn56C]|uniref:chemotaxis protein CheB n=1 Tax=Sphingobacterium sp. Mn56C TaxID=3395261 RepID=UPI003BCB357E
MEVATEIILIGGSAGSYNLITEILDALPLQFNYALIIIIHRNPSFSTRIEKNLAQKLNRPIISVKDKTAILSNSVYFAPPGYHLLVEPDGNFSLDVSEPINYSRPSIDVAFETAAQVYTQKCTGFLLSGANQDGANGIRIIEEYGGKAYIQTPDEAIIETMPMSAVKVSLQQNLLRNAEIINFFSSKN